MVSQAFVSHPSRRCKYQWGECALLYFCDARVVFSLLFIFMNPVDLLGAKISIRVRIGMTHPYIQIIITIIIIIIVYLNFGQDFALQCMLRSGELEGATSRK